MCIMGGDWRWPEEPGKKGKSNPSDSFSEGVKEVVSQCLRVEPNERPDVDQLMQLVKDAIAQLPEADDVLDG